MANTIVVVPCYNEELTIRKVVRDIRHTLPDAKIYVYDNNSTDNTTEIIKAIANQDNNIEVRFCYTQGKGAVVRQALSEIDAEHYVLIDGDDTYPVEAITSMLLELNHGNYDIVVGDRLSNGMSSTRPFQEAGNKIVTWLVKRLYGRKIPDVMSGLRVFNRKVAKTFVPEKNGFEIETEMAIYVAQNNLAVSSIPICYNNRPTGSKSKLHAIKDGIKILMCIFKGRHTKNHSTKLQDSNSERPMEAQQYARS